MTKKHATSLSKRNNKTKRCGRVRSRSRRRISYRVKRGGMLRAVVRSNTERMRTFIINKVIPLITTYDNHVAGYNPHPSDGSVVKYGERYYRTFADIPIDKGLKEDIDNLKKGLEELDDPVKNYDKIKLVYDKVISKLDEEKRQQEAKERVRTLAPNTTPTLSSSSNYPLLESSLKTPVYVKPINRDDALRKVMGPIFMSPNTLMNPQYSIDNRTSSKPLNHSSLVNPRSLDSPDNLLASSARPLFGRPDEHLSLSSPVSSLSPVEHNSFTPDEHLLLSSPVSRRLLFSPVRPLSLASPVKTLKLQP